MARIIPKREDITRDTPLRLDVAAALAFPDGSIKLSSLRREAARGNLTVWRIANKFMTTLAEIEAMKEKCRVQRKAPDYGCDQNGRTGVERSLPIQSGSSSMVESTLPQDAVREKIRQLKQRSQITSAANTNQNVSNAA